MSSFGAKRKARVIKVHDEDGTGAGAASNVGGGGDSTGKRTENDFDGRTTLMLGGKADLGVA